MTEDILRTISLCILLAGMETLHGIFRAVWLVPRTGKKLALKIAIVTGSLLAFAVCYLSVPAFGYTSSAELFRLGLILALFMAGFDIALGKFLLKLPWRKILQDFDPRTGNYLLVGLLSLASFPFLVMQVQ